MSEVSMPPPAEVLTPQITPEASPQNTELRDAIKNAGSSIISAEQQKAVDSTRSMPVADSATYLRENPGKNALVSLDSLSNPNLQPNENGIDLTEGGVAKPIKIVKEGTEYTLNKIISVSENTFTVTTSEDGTQVELTKEEVKNALVVAERESIISEIPDAQKPIVEKYLNILASDLLEQTDPLADLTPDELINLAELAEKSLTSPETDTEKTKEELKLESDIKIQKESGAIYAIGFQNRTRDHYADKYTDFKPNEKFALDAEAKRLGRNLTQEEADIVKMKCVKLKQQSNTDEYPDTPQIESTTQLWIQNQIKLTGEHPTPEQVSSYRQQLKFSYANQEDLSVVMDKDKLAKLQNELSKKDWSAFLAFIMLKMGAEFVNDFIPQGR